MYFDFFPPGNLSIQFAYCNYTNSGQNDQDSIDRNFWQNVFIFIFIFFLNKYVADLLTTKPRGAGLKTLVDCSLKKNFFCGFPYEILSNAILWGLCFTVEVCWMLYNVISGMKTTFYNQHMKRKYVRITNRNSNLMYKDLKSVHMRYFNLFWSC